MSDQRADKSLYEEFWKKIMMLSEILINSLHLEIHPNPSPDLHNP